MRNKNRGLIALVMLSMLLAACGGESQAPSMPAPAVTVVTLKSEPITLTRELPGRTNPFKVAEVRPQVNGIVEQQLFNEGGLVEAGQPLYQLDDATYKADYDSARAALQRAEAAQKIARLNARRSADLVKTGAVSKEHNDTATATQEQAEADVAAARAALQRSKIQLNYARIATPISGRIGKSTVTQGALVTANQQAALATVQQLDPIYVDLTQSFSELLDLRRALDAGTVEQTDDLPVTILLEDGSTYAHSGKLAFSEVSVDPSTGSVLLRVLVPNPEHMLLPGMYVRAVIGRGVRENAILVPQQSIARDPKGNASAMVVDAEGKVEQRVVQVSRTIGDRWLVESGLKADEKVILEGLQKVGPGAAVQASEAVIEQMSAPAVESADEKDTAADAAETVPVSAADES